LDGVIGAVASLLLMFGLLGIYLAYAERFGTFGLIGFMVALFAQGAWAATLFLEGV
jgi:hypothetical protein